jgi:O-antigen/teichoic acid export membrane protein
LKPLTKLANQTVIYGLSSVIGRLLNYLLVPLYTRYFVPAEYGVVTEMYAYVAFLVVFLTYGMETAFFRFAQKEKNINKAYSTTLISITITSIAFLSITFLSSQSIANWMGYTQNKEYIEWFAIIVVLDAISSISFAKLRQKNKAIRFSLIRILNIFCNIGCNIYFIVFKGLGIEYIFISNLISSILTITLLAPEMFRIKWIFDVYLWKKMIYYAFPLLIAGLAGITNETIDRILLKKLLPTEDIAITELGLYGAFYKLSIIMIMFIQTFRFAAEPFFFSQQKTKNARKIYADVMAIFTAITTTIFLIVIIFYDIFIQFLGEGYRDERGFYVVSILLLANIFLGIYYNLSIWYKLTDKTKYGAYLSMFGAIITVVLNIALIPKIGFLGSAWATLSCYFCMTIASYFMGKKHYPIPYNLKKMSFYILAMLGIYFIIINTGTNTWFNTLYLLVFIALIFLIEKPKKIVFSNPKKFNKNEYKNSQ